MGEHHAVLWAGLYCVPLFEGEKGGVGGGNTCFIDGHCSAVSVSLGVIRKIQSGLAPLLGKHIPPPLQNVAAGKLPPIQHRHESHTVLSTYNSAKSGSQISSA